MTDAKKAARQGGSYQNTHSHSSNIAAQCNAPFDSIADTILGQQEGVRFVRDLCDGISAPDAMFIRMQEIATAPATMRGFCRALQKYIERGTA